MSTGLPRPGLARSAHRGRIKFIRGYISKSSAAVNRPTHDHAASLHVRGAFRGPAHQLAVRMRINNCTHGHNNNYGPSNQFSRHISRTQSFQQNRHIIFRALVALNLLVSLTPESCPIACSTLTCITHAMTQL